MVCLGVFRPVGLSGMQFESSWRWREPLAKRALDIEQSCAIWNSLDAMNGEATISQVGQVLSIDFGSGIRFEGTRTGDQVSLGYEHEHPFSDGCQWRASELLSGSIDPVSCSLNFRYAYDEQPISTPPCATPCSARANVDVMFTIIR